MRFNLKLVFISLAILISDIFGSINKLDLIFLSLIVIIKKFIKNLILQINTRIKPKFYQMLKSMEASVLKVSLKKMVGKQTYLQIFQGMQMQ